MAEESTISAIFMALFIALCITAASAFSSVSITYGTIKKCDDKDLECQKTTYGWFIGGIISAVAVLMISTLIIYIVRARLRQPGSYSSFI